MKAADKQKAVRAMQSREAVGRFLGCEGEEVGRMIEMDELPCVRIPGETRPRIRIYLPDFHAWLAKRSYGERIKSYEEFLVEFGRTVG